MLFLCRKTFKLLFLAATKAFSFPRLRLPSNRSVFINFEEQCFQAARDYLHFDVKRCLPKVDVYLLRIVRFCVSIQTYQGDKTQSYHDVAKTHHEHQSENHPSFVMKIKVPAHKRYLGKIRRT